MFELMLLNNDFLNPGGWKKLSFPLAQGVRSPKLVADDRYVYMLNGVLTSGTYNNSVWRYDTVNDTWTLVSNSFPGRFDAGCALLDGKIYNFAGRLAGTLTTSIHSFDPSSGVLVTKNAVHPTTGVYALNALTMGSKIYLVGGRASGTVQSNLLYDPVADTLTAKAETTGRILDTAFALDDTRYVRALGALAGVNTDVATMYDITTNTWTDLNNAPMALFSGASASLDGTGYVYGGTTGTVQSNSWTFKDNTWRDNLLTPNPGARCRHAMVSCNGKIYLAGGDANTTPYFADFWEYTPGTEID